MSDIEREAFKRTERHFKQAKTPAKVVDCHSLDVKFISDFTHWKAARLTCPKPPKEQDNEG